MDERVIIDPLLVSPSLIDLCLNYLHFLTDLQIKCYNGNSDILLIDILQNLTMLKTLKFDTVKINDDTYAYPFYDKISTNKHETKHEGRLESVQLTYNISISSKPIIYLQTKLSFQLCSRSCSKLKSRK